MDRFLWNRLERRARRVVALVWDLPQNLWVKKGRRALNGSVFLDAGQQPSPSGRQKGHDFKHRRPDTSVHVFVLSLRLARSLPE